MYALRMLIATTDPYHLLMAGYALGCMCTAGALWLVKVVRNG